MELKPWQWFGLAAVFVMAQQAKILRTTALLNAHATVVQISERPIGGQSQISLDVVRKLIEELPIGEEKT